jgi:hypothetical protein
MMLPAEKVMVQFCYRGRRRKISWLCNNSQLPRKTSQEKAKGLKTVFPRKNPARPPRNEWKKINWNCSRTFISMTWH